MNRVNEFPGPSPALADIEGCWAFESGKTKHKASNNTGPLYFILGSFSDCLPLPLIYAIAVHGPKPLQVSAFLLASVRRLPSSAELSGLDSGGDLLQSNPRASV